MTTIFYTQVSLCYVLNKMKNDSMRTNTQTTSYQQNMKMLFLTFCSIYIKKDEMKRSFYLSIIHLFLRYRTKTH